MMYDEIFHLGETVRVRVYPDAGDPSQWGPLDEDQLAVIRKRQKDCVAKAQERYYLTPKTDWWYSDPEIIRRRKDCYHIQSDYEEEHYCLFRYVQLRHYLKMYAITYIYKLIYVIVYNGT